MQSSPGESRMCHILAVKCESQSTLELVVLLIERKYEATTGSLKIKMLFV